MNSSFLIKKYNWLVKYILEHKHKCSTQCCKNLNSSNIPGRYKESLVDFILCFLCLYNCMEFTLHSGSKVQMRICLVSPCFLYHVPLSSFLNKCTWRDCCSNLSISPYNFTAVPQLLIYFCGICVNRHEQTV